MNDLRRLRRMAVPLLALLILTACLPFRAQQAAEPLLTRGQTLTQLHLQQEAEAGAEMTAAWIPYFICSRLFAEADEAVCRSAVSDYLTKLRERGINTVFVHVCPFGESMYPSEYYPPAAECSGHDAMRIFTEICAAQGIALHAWINPLRLQMQSAVSGGGDALLSQWYADAETCGRNLFLWEGRYYLNPVTNDTADFLAGAVTELVGRYHPAGIHIDDYFYPTTDPSVDAAAFAASGGTDLSAWRRDRVSELVQRMCSAVHAADASAVFSVSPQGNLTLNRDTLYADVTRWMEEAGYCDLMIPQIYYGYRNASCPFTETLAEWCALPRSETVELAVGLASYKVGAYDEYAGSGADEWQTEADVLDRQILQVRGQSGLSGISFYHADAFLEQQPE